MKHSTLTFLVLLSVLSNFSEAAETSKKGKFFVNFATLTSNYEFSLRDTLEEVPDDISAFFSNNAQQNDSDFLNVSIGIGYYLKDNLSLRLHYADDIGLYNNSAFNILGSLFNTIEFQGNMSIFEIDAKYNFVEINEQASLFVVVGAAYHQLDAKVLDLGASDINNQVLIQSDIDKWDSKFGGGVQYDFNQRFGMNFGYTHYSFSSIDKTYIEFEYRF